MILLFLLISLSLASADIFKYVDENGVTCYTDAPFGKKTEQVVKEKLVMQGKRKAEERVAVYRGDYSGYVRKAAAKYQLEPDLIHAVIKTESNGNHRAVSRKGAIGLMQLMPSTANDMNVSNPFNPEENIDGGAKYLKYLLERFNGNLTLALAAYNSGPKTVEKFKSVPPITETRQYVNRIFSLYGGKRQISPSLSVGIMQEQSHTIYKVVLDDGTILFTNASLDKTSKLRF